MEEEEEIFYWFTVETGWEKEWSKASSELRSDVGEAVISVSIGILFGFYFILLLGFSFLNFFF